MMNEIEETMSKIHDFSDSTSCGDGAGSHFLENTGCKPNLKREEGNEKTKSLTSTPQETGNPRIQVKMKILDVPNFLMKLVFSYLDIRERLKVELVCRKWRLIGKVLPWNGPTKLVFNSEARESSLGICSCDLNDHILQSLLSRCGSCLKSLVITFDSIDYVPLTSQCLWLISKHCPNIETINLQGVPADSDSVKAIATNCPKLKDLCLAADSRNRDCSEGVLCIIRKCTALEALKIAFVFLTKDWFDVVNRNLKILHLTQCPMLSGKVIRNLKNNCDSLEELCFTTCNSQQEDVVAQFRMVQYFRHSLKHLSVLHDNDVSSSQDWMDGLRNLSSLKSLNMYTSKDSIDDKLMEHIVKECPNLERLSIPSCCVTDNGVAVLAGLPLVSLNVCCNGTITDKGLEAIIKKVDLQLVSLVVSFMPGISENFCCTLAKTCPKLRYLNVSGNKKMTNRLVTNFRLAVQKGFLTPPVQLVVSNTSILSRVKRCPGLELDFSTKDERGFSSMLTAKEN